MHGIEALAAALRTAHQYAENARSECELRANLLAADEYGVLASRIEALIGEFAHRLTADDPTRYDSGWTERRG